MTQAIDESCAQRSANLQKSAEELAQLNPIATALTSAYDLPPPPQKIADAARKMSAFFLKSG